MNILLLTWGLDHEHILPHPIGSLLHHRIFTKIKQRFNKWYTCSSSCYPQIAPYYQPTLDYVCRTSFPLSSLLMMDQTPIQVIKNRLKWYYYHDNSINIIHKLSDSWIPAS